MNDGAQRSDVPAFDDSPARLDLMSVAEMDAAQRALYDAITGGPRASQAGTVPITDDEGRLLGPFAAMLLSPEVGNAVQQVGAKIRFATGLTARERELGILTVAGELRCDFERLAHEPAARNLGLGQAQIDAALTGRIPDGLTEQEALVCRLTGLMAASRQLPDQDYEAALALLGKARLAELTWLVGYYSALALALAVFRPVLPEGFTQPR
jgi:alkylhydroperoxidase family enzyme